YWTCGSDDAISAAAVACAAVPEGGWPSRLLPPHAATASAIVHIARILMMRNPPCAMVMMRCGISLRSGIEGTQPRDLGRSRHGQRREVGARFHLTPIAVKVLDEIAAVLERVHNVAVVVGVRQPDRVAE